MVPAPGLLDQSSRDVSHTGGERKEEGRRKRERKWKISRGSSQQFLPLPLIISIPLKEEEYEEEGEGEKKAPLLFPLLPQEE